MTITTFPANNYEETGEVRIPEAGEFFLSQGYPGNVRNDGNGFSFGERKIVRPRPFATLSDSSDRVVFSVEQEPTIQIRGIGKAFISKRGLATLELTPAEAAQVLRQLDAVLL